MDSGSRKTLEKEMAAHSSVLAWRIPWTEEPGGLHTVHGVAKSRTRLSDFTFFLSIVPFGEGHGNPLQCSCLENPMDRGAWWGCGLWGCKELDTTKQLIHTHTQHYVSTSVYLIYSARCFYILVFVWFVHLKKCNSDGKKIIHS